ncbi:extracellular matrix-binding protein ebh isoform X3 [Macrosteles quadrilineatus]|uniref:extracellular matrix-binding protein ebh isoform X3 n=1 Tax=Macrosteles quadrilineatus TaxID=74068 RepID=UPI0023E28710|nr:extracellular matrix-binding protein ebh isoform X3 [Macrosteles quadrilineatus]
MDFFNKLLHRTSGGGGGNPKSPPTSPSSKASESLKPKSDNSFISKGEQDVLSSVDSSKSDTGNEDLKLPQIRIPQSPGNDMEEEDRFEDAVENKLNLTALADNLDKFHLSTPGKIQPRPDEFTSFSVKELGSPDSVIDLCASYSYNESFRSLDNSFQITDGAHNSSDSSVEFIGRVSAGKENSIVKAERQSLGSENVNNSQVNVSGISSIERSGEKTVGVDYPLQSVEGAQKKSESSAEFIGVVPDEKESSNVEVENQSLGSENANHSQVNVSGINSIEESAEEIVEVVHYLQSLEGAQNKSGSSAEFIGDVPDERESSNVEVENQSLGSENANQSQVNVSGINSIEESAEEIVEVVHYLQSLEGAQNKSGSSAEFIGVVPDERESSNVEVENQSLGSENANQSQVNVSGINSIEESAEEIVEVVHYLQSLEGVQNKSGSSAEFIGVVPDEKESSNVEVENQSLGSENANQSQVNVSGINSIEESAEEIVEVVHYLQSLEGAQNKSGSSAEFIGDVPDERESSNVEVENQSLGSENANQSQVNVSGINSIEESAEEIVEVVHYLQSLEGVQNKSGSSAEFIGVVPDERESSNVEVENQSLGSENANHSQVNVSGINSIEESAEEIVEVVHYLQSLEGAQNKSGSSAEFIGDVPDERESSNVEVENQSLGSENANHSQVNVSGINSIEESAEEIVEVVHYLQSLEGAQNKSGSSAEFIGDVPDERESSNVEVENQSLGSENANHSQVNVSGINSIEESAEEIVEVVHYLQSLEGAQNKSGSSAEFIGVVPDERESSNVEVENQSLGSENANQSQVNVSGINSIEESAEEIVEVVHYLQSLEGAQNKSGSSAEFIGDVPDERESSNVEVENQSLGSENANQSQVNVSGINSIEESAEEIVEVVHYLQSLEGVQNKSGSSAEFIGVVPDERESSNVEVENQSLGSENANHSQVNVSGINSIEESAEEIVEVVHYLQSLEGAQNKSGSSAEFIGDVPDERESSNVEVENQSLGSENANHSQVNVSGINSIEESAEEIVEVVHYLQSLEGAQNKSGSSAEFIGDVPDERESSNVEVENQSLGSENANHSQVNVSGINSIEESAEEIVEVVHYLQSLEGAQNKSGSSVEFIGVVPDEKESSNVEAENQSLSSENANHSQVNVSGINSIEESAEEIVEVGNSLKSVGAQNKSRQSEEFIIVASGKEKVVETVKNLSTYENVNACQSIVSDIKESVKEIDQHVENQITSSVDPVLSDSTNRLSLIEETDGNTENGNYSFHTEGDLKENKSLSEKSQTTLESSPTNQNTSSDYSFVGGLASSSMCKRNSFGIEDLISSIEKINITDSFTKETTSSSEVLFYKKESAAEVIQTDCVKETISGHITLNDSSNKQNSSAETHITTKRVLSDEINSCDFKDQMREKEFPSEESKTDSITETETLDDTIPNSLDATNKENLSLVSESGDNMEAVKSDITLPSSRSYLVSEESVPADKSQSVNHEKEDKEETVLVSKTNISVVEKIVVPDEPKADAPNKFSPDGVKKTSSVNTIEKISAEEDSTIKVAISEDTLSDTNDSSNEKKLLEDSQTDNDATNNVLLHDVQVSNSVDPLNEKKIPAEQGNTIKVVISEDTLPDTKDSLNEKKLPEESKTVNDATKEMSFDDVKLSSSVNPLNGKKMPAEEDNTIRVVISEDMLPDPVNPIKEKTLPAEKTVPDPVPGNTKKVKSDDPSDDVKILGSAHPLNETKLPPQDSELIGNVEGVKSDNTTLSSSSFSEPLDENKLIVEECKVLSSSNNTLNEKKLPFEVSERDNDVKEVKSNDMLTISSKSSNENVQYFDTKENHSVDESNQSFIGMSMNSFTSRNSSSIMKAETETPPINVNMIDYIMRPGGKEELEELIRSNYETHYRTHYSLLKNKSSPVETVSGDTITNVHVQTELQKSTKENINKDIKSVDLNEDSKVEVIIPPKENKIASSSEISCDDAESSHALLKSKSSPFKLNQSEETYKKMHLSNKKKELNPVNEQAHHTSSIKDICSGKTSLGENVFESSNESNTIHRNESLFKDCYELSKSQTKDSKSDTSVQNRVSTNPAEVNSLESVEKFDSLEDDFDDILMKEAANVSEHILNVSRELDESDSEGDVNKTVITVEETSNATKNDERIPPRSTVSKTPSSLSPRYTVSKTPPSLSPRSTVSKTPSSFSPRSSKQTTFKQPFGVAESSINSYMESMRAVLPSHLNQSEAGPITADELSTEDLEFRDGANLDLDFFTQVGNTEGIIKTSLTRDSLYVKFDPIVGALVSKAISDKFTMPPPSAPVEEKQTEDSPSKPQSEDSAADVPKTPGRSPALEAVQKLISLTPPAPAKTPSSTSPEAAATKSDQNPSTKRERPCSTKTDRAPKQERPCTARMVTNTPTSSSQKSASHDQLKKEINKLERLVLQQESESKAAATQHKADLQQKDADLVAAHARVVELEAEMKAIKEREQRLKKEVVNKDKSKQQLSLVMEEYEKTISQLVAQKEEDRKKFEEEKEMLMKERDTAMQHLNNMEIAFNDVHQKYERSKTVIEGMKANEEILKRSLAEFDEAVKSSTAKYETLKSHAVKQLEQANQELDTLQRSHQVEIAKLKAMLKKSDVRIKSLEESLDQKTKENAELTAICDELISKVGGT